MTLNRRALVVAALSLALADQSRATAQIPEELIFDGEKDALFSEPLESYLLRGKNQKKLDSLLVANGCTASWRGYQGTWEIKNSRLYLVRLVSDPCDERPKDIPLGKLFSGAGSAVHADWFTGELVVPRGKQLKYVHMGYLSKYERYIVFTVSGGNVTGRREESTPPK